MQPNMFKITFAITETFTKAVDNTEKRFVRGRASGTALDLDEERMAESAIVAFRSAIQEGIFLPDGRWSLVPLLAAHRDGWVGDILGWLVDAEIDQNFDLYITAELDSDNPDADLLWKKLNRPPEHGKPVRLGLSVGGVVLSAGQEWDESLQRFVRVFYDVALREVSVVSHPAYPTAYLSAMAKSVDWERVGLQTRLVEHVQDIWKAALWRVGAARDLPIRDEDDWDGDAARDAIFAWAGWPDAPQPARARRAFLAYDASAPTEKQSYKLPFARPIDGELYAIAGGLRAAASRLPQTDIPSSVKERARQVLDGYFARMSEEKQMEKLEPTVEAHQEEVEVEKASEEVIEAVVDEVEQPLTKSEDLVEPTPDVDAIAELRAQVADVMKRLDDLTAMLHERLQKDTEPAAEAVVEKQVETEAAPAPQAEGPAFSVDEIVKAIRDVVTEAVKPLEERLKAIEEMPVDKSISVAKAKTGASDGSPLELYEQAAESVDGKQALRIALEHAFGKR